MNEGAEPQTVKQYVPAAVSLERGCDELHGDRAHVCSDVSVVPGNLQVDADAARFMSDRMPSVLESGAGASANISRHHHDASAGCETVEQYELLEIGHAGSCARVSRHLPDAFSGVAGGSRLIVAARSRSGLGSFVRNSSLSSHHVDHLHTHGVCCAHGEHDLHDARTNSCLGSHAARNNSLGLHSACDNFRGTC